MIKQNRIAKLLAGTFFLSQTLLISAAGASDVQRNTRTDLSTSQGFELGGQISSYHYKEPNLPDGSGGFLDVKIDGTKFGLTGTATQKFGKSRVWFGRAEARGAYGQVDYSGSGTSDGEDDILLEGRLLVGRDSVSRRVGLSPYTGFGFRYLYNDARGTTTFNGQTYYGYERESQYMYIPVGITPRFYAGHNARIATNIEYDQLIYGKQTSDFTSLGGPSLENDQNSGYGIRGSIFYEKQHWAFGPFFNYWNIEDSEEDCAGTFCGIEPHNKTWEYGLELRYRF